MLIMQISGADGNALLGSRIILCTFCIYRILRRGVGMLVVTKKDEKQKETQGAC